MTDRAALSPGLNRRRVGFAGLGLMGKPMARNLLAAGADLTVWNRSPGPREALCETGATGVDSPGALARTMAGQEIILMLKDTEAVAAVVEGPEGLFAGLQPDTLVIDMGATGLRETRLWAAETRRLGGDWLDAPVSGGEVGAREATLSIMAGGERSAFERAEPLLQVLGGTVTYLGGTGAGQITKLANQIIVANTLAAVAEAFRMADAAGADLAAVRRALLGGFAASRILDLHGLRMIVGDYTPGGKATGQLKDAREGLRTAAELGLRLPMLEANHPIWQALVDAGLGELDHSAIYRFYQNNLLPESKP